MIKTPPGQTSLLIKMESLREKLDEVGFLVLNEVLSLDEVNLYRGLYEDFMSGKLDASAHRHDLGSHRETKTKQAENITQIMWPSLYFDSKNSPLHEKALKLAKELMGEDMEMDFDMLISKESICKQTAEICRNFG